MSSSKSLKPWPCHFFHLGKPLILRLAFDAAERNRRLAFRAENIKGTAEEKKRAESVPLQRKVIIDVESKVIPTRFLKIDRRRTLIGVRKRIKRDSEKTGK